MCDNIMQRLHDQVLVESFIGQTAEQAAGRPLTCGSALQCVIMLSQDSFYRGLTEDELANVGSKSSAGPALLYAWLRELCHVVLWD